jgi:hypothetical protein
MGDGCCAVVAAYGLGGRFPPVFLRALGNLVAGFSLLERGRAFLERGFYASSLFCMQRLLHAKDA